MSAWGTTEVVPSHRGLVWTGEGARPSADILISAATPAVQSSFSAARGAVPSQNLEDLIPLFAHRRWNARFASLFLQIFELLFGVIDGLLLGGDLLFVFRVFFVPGSRVAKAVARVSVERGGTKAVFAIRDVQFTG